MQAEKDSFECSEQIAQHVVSNVVSCNSINQLILQQEPAKPQQSQGEITQQKLHEILNTSYIQLKEGHFMNAIKLMNTYWKVISSQQTEWKLRLCFFLNMSCGYQGLWNLQMCDSTCQITENQILSILKNVQQVEQKIKLQLILLILRMQHCAIYSQMGAHQKALITGQENLQGLKQCLSTILLFTTKLKEEDNKSNDKSGRIRFSLKIQRYLELLKSLIKDLEDNIKIEYYNKRPIFYNWKNNPQTNQKFVRQIFASKHILTKDEESRSILGLHQQDNTWITQFNIGSIMHMSPFSYTSFQSGSIFDQFQKKKLYEKVIYASVLHFTIATQMRFIDTQNSQSTIASVKLKTEVNYRSKTSQISQLYHLKAIQLMCKGISSKSPYLNHLINSYHKHYMQTLISINQQQSIISQIRDRIQSRPKKQDQDYFRMTQGNILTEPQIIPTPRKIKQLKSSQFRGTSKSLQLRKQKKMRQNSLKNLRTHYVKSPLSNKQLKKKPLKINMLKKAMNSKDCQVRLTTRSQTQIKLIMNRKNK